jgi:hypothetical protein
MGVTSQEIRDGSGNTVATETTLVPRPAVPPRPRVGIAMTVRTVRLGDAIRHLIAVASPLAVVPVTMVGATGSATGTMGMIDEGGMIRAIVTGVLRRRTIGMREMTGVGTAIGIGR